jgi:hypothetical protein
MSKPIIEFIIPFFIPFTEISKELYDPTILHQDAIHISYNKCVICNNKSHIGQYVYWTNINLYNGHCCWRHCDNIECIKHVTNFRDTFTDKIKEELPLNFWDDFMGNNDIRIMGYADGRIMFKDLILALFVYKKPLHLVWIQYNFSQNYPLYPHMNMIDQLANVSAHQISIEELTKLNIDIV